MARHNTHLLFQGDLAVFQARTDDGYRYLIVAPVGDLYAIKTALNEINQQRAIADSVEDTPTNRKLAAANNATTNLVGLERLYLEGLAITSAGKQLLTPRPIKHKRAKKAKVAAARKKKKRVMSQETKDKISRSRKAAYSQSSLLRAVEQGGPEVPPPASPPA